jgi:hypothetical protein
MKTNTYKDWDPCTYKSMSKNDRGDIISKGNAKTKYVTNPFTNEKVPVYSKEEEGLLLELYEIEDIIIEYEEYLEKETIGCRRDELRKDIEAHEEYYEEITEKLDILREEDDWNEVRKKQKKLAAEKEKKAKASKKKKDDAKSKAKREKEEAEAKAEAKEKRRIVKLRAERKKIMDSMPDEIRDITDNLFN